MYEEIDDVESMVRGAMCNYLNGQATKSRAQVDELENVTLNIGVTGESGSGKSTFVNAMRGLRHGDEGAAETGVVETTVKPMRYSHPTMPNVYIWDLPGIGTPNFKAKNYLKKVQFHLFDFFIIITSVRFKENDLMLAKKIKKMKKPYYFVRSKIDNDIRMEREKPGFNEHDVLAKIRQNCEQNLSRAGNPEVFLISTFQLHKYDFQKLVESLEKSLPQHKRFALIQSLPMCSPAMVDKKRKTLNSTAFAAAAGAGLSTVIPIPGVSIGCEIGIMLSLLKKSYAAFCLDEQSIRRLALRVNKPEAKLRLVMTSRFAMGVNNRVVRSMLSTPAMTVAKVGEALLTLFPIFGTAPALVMAYNSTLHLLLEGIQDMAIDAISVLNAVSEDCTIPSDV